MSSRLAQLDVSAAASVLRSGGVVAYPTEAVWGLGCDPFNTQAVERILALKGRPGEKGLILIAADRDQVLPLIRDPEELAVADSSWPGPVTWVFHASESAPGPVCPGDGSIAVRVTDHPGCQALCRAFGGALVSTSANPQGQEPARDAEQVRAYFGDTLDGLLPGATGGLAQPSTIRDARSGAVLRDS